jgi:hypothetical protein
MQSTKEGGRERDSESANLGKDYEAEEVAMEENKRYKYVRRSQQFYTFNK